MSSNLETMSEQELREYKTPSPDSIAELASIIETLANRQHDYGTCVYAMSISAEAAFRYIAKKLGVTGFQASCADMDILTRTRRMNGPWRIQDHANLLYPQYANEDYYPSPDDLLRKHADWFRTEAKKRLAKDNRHIHPDVLHWWEKLASLPPQEREE